MLLCRDRHFTNGQGERSPHKLLVNTANKKTIKQRNDVQPSAVI